MNKQKIYLDTSVIGGCFDKEFSKWSLSLFRDIKYGLFIPVTSEVVKVEIKKAPEFVRLKFKELLDYNPLILDLDKEVLELAKIYQDRKVVPIKYFEDALHIALATINNIDILVSWNFKHIVRYDKIRFFNSINLELGYKTIEIYSPMEVTLHE